MHIEEFKEEVEEVEVEEKLLDKEEKVVEFDAKRVLVGAGARVLFYPTLLYNVVRNKIEAEFRWWDQIDEFLLLGAVPFPSDVIKLKELGVCGVITLNEPYETLVPTTLYQAHGIDHLVLPTRDYLFAPSLTDICRAVEFINENSLQGRSTYVHCKAGRGRSTTIVLCYLVQHKQMTPDAAYAYVKSIRPRVLLAPAQIQAVQEYYKLKVDEEPNSCYENTSVSQLNNAEVTRPLRLLGAADVFAFDDGSVVLVTNTDLDGYDPNKESSDGDAQGNDWADSSLVYRVRVVGQTALGKLSCMWLPCNTDKMISSEKLCQESRCLIRGSNQVGDVTVNIHVY